MITVVFRDDSALAHTGAGPDYRTVRVRLTPEQSQALMARNGYETVAQAIVEKARED